MNEPPSCILLLQNPLSRLNLHFTNTTITIAMMAEHKYGRPHPTPNTTLFGNSMTKTVVAVATIGNLTPQRQLNTDIILRNMRNPKQNPKALGATVALLRWRTY
jgi:hypothetical protein